MKAIKTTSSALSLKLAELAEINAQIENAQITVDAVSPGNNELEKLIKQRVDEIGRAFIDKREPEIAAFDKAIARIQKDAMAIRTAAEAAASAINLLKLRAMEIEFAELPPMVAAQDEAINAFVAKKEDEAEEMLTKALADVTTAFEHMAAAGAMSRKPISMADLTPGWKHRLDRLVTEKLHINVKPEAATAKLKADLMNAGVTDPGVRRFASRPVLAPPQAGPETMVRITTAKPTTPQEELHDARFGSAVRITQLA